MRQLDRLIKEAWIVLIISGQQRCSAIRTPDLWICGRVHEELGVSFVDHLWHRRHITCTHLAIAGDFRASHPA